MTREINGHRPEVWLPRMAQLAQRDLPAPSPGEQAQPWPAAGFNGDIVEEWGRQSFPASDPPANW